MITVTEMSFTLPWRCKCGAIIKAGEMHGKNDGCLNPSIDDKSLQEMATHTATHFPSMTAPPEICRALGLPDGASVEECVAEIRKFTDVEDFPASLQVNCGTFKPESQDSTHRDFINVSKDLWKRIRSERDEATTKLAEAEARERKLREALEKTVDCLDYSNYYCDCGHPACKICDYVKDEKIAREAARAALAQTEETK